jgi:hypothetical protein
MESSFRGWLACTCDVDLLCLFLRLLEADQDKVHRTPSRPLLATGRVCVVQCGYNTPGVN